ncbi:MAG: hypothetical protein ACM3X6_11370 [Patescibacteria group bacterium]
MSRDARPGEAGFLTYLDEFAYRFNRRRAPGIFGRCLAAVAACPAWTNRDITGAGAKAKLKAVWIS